MESVAALKSALESIEAKLRSGVTRVTTDGTSTEVDLNALRMERDRLQRRIDAAEATAKRPAASRIYLGGF